MSATNLRNRSLGFEEAPNIHDDLFVEVWPL
jgi:hypothetical protein